MKSLIAVIIAAVLLPWQSRAQDITPCVDAIEQVSPGTYRYWFGYRSTFSTSVTLTTTVSVGFQNPVHTSRADTFKTGRHFALFHAQQFTVWNIGGRTAYADYNFYSAYQSAADRPLDILPEKPFAARGVLWFIPRTVVQDGVTTYEFRWWRRDPATGFMIDGLPWYIDNTAAPINSVTQVVVVTQADKADALTRLGLASNTQNDQRAIVNAALRKVDGISD
jgi:hypothetical protein